MIIICSFVFMIIPLKAYHSHWAHMRRNVVKKLSLASREARDELCRVYSRDRRNKYSTTMQLSSSSRIFKKAKSLFRQKWEEAREFF